MKRNAQSGITAFCLVAGVFAVIVSQKEQDHEYVKKLLQISPVKNQRSVLGNSFCLMFVRCRIPARSKASLLPETEI